MKGKLFCGVSTTALFMLMLSGCGSKSVDEVNSNSPTLAGNFIVSTTEAVTSATTTEEITEIVTEVTTEEITEITEVTTEKIQKEITEINNNDKIQEEVTEITTEEIQEEITEISNSDNNDSENMQQEIQTSIEKKVEQELLIYYSNDNADALLVDTVDVSDIDAQTILDLLISKQVIPESTKLNSFNIIDKKGILDVSNDLTSYNYGTSGESMMLEAIANTYIKAFNLDKFQILLDGKYYSSGHIEFDKEDYFTFKSY